MYSLSATFSNEESKQEGSFPLDLFVVNASISGTDYTYYANINHDIVGYQMDSNGNLLATEQTYTGLPITRNNITNTIDGEISSVEVSIPNVDRTIEAIIQSNNYLRGSEIYILSTFADFLPSGSAYTYMGTTPDKNAIMKEKLYIDGVSSNEEVVTFTCKPKFTVKNIVLPLRRYTRECSWIYGTTTECGVAATTLAAKPTCNFTLASCIERNNSSRFGGFTSIPRGALYI